MTGTVDLRVIVQAERPRARRYAFPANVELVDADSEQVLRAKTCDLSLFGCRIKCPSAWPVGTKVRLKITYKGAAFNASGRVVHVQGTTDMGVAFAKLDNKDQLVLEIWMAELRGSSVPSAVRGL